MSGASGIHRLALFSHPANLVMKGLIELKKQRTKKPKSASGKLPGVKLEVA